MSCEKRSFPTFRHLGSAALDLRSIAPFFHKKSSIFTFLGQTRLLLLFLGNEVGYYQKESPKGSRKVSSETHIVTILAAIVVLCHENHLDVIDEWFHIAGLKKVGKDRPYTLDTCAAWLQEGETPSKLEPGFDLAVLAELLLRLPKGSHNLNRREEDRVRSETKRGCTKSFALTSSQIA